MNEKIANILKERLTGFDFVDKIAGLARPIIINQPGPNNTPVQKVFPIACDITHDDCITGRYKDLIPNSKYGSIIYFEDSGTAMQYVGKGWVNFNSRLNLVCWMNLKKLGECSVCTTSTAVMLSILSAFPEFPIDDNNYFPIRAVKVVGISEAVKSNAIFSKYSYDETVNQYLLYPFDFFSLNLSVDFRVNLECVEQFQKGTPCIC